MPHVVNFIDVNPGRESAQRDDLTMILFRYVCRGSQKNSSVSQGDYDVYFSRLRSVYQERN
jgi:hypothetical protein